MKVFLPLIFSLLVACDARPEPDEPPIGDENPDAGITDPDDEVDVDCESFTEEECRQESACVPGEGWTRESFCANDLTSYTYYGCERYISDPGCGDAVICITTQAGDIYLSTSCNPNGYPRCETDC